jgi:nitrite reductase (NADH) small subunit
MSQPRLVPLLPTSSLAPGEATEVVAEGRLFAVFHVADEWHVLDGICPHAGGPLGQGTLQDGILTCPWHGWQFDVRTGQHCLSSQICQPRFNVQIQNDQVCVELEEPPAS